MPHSAQVRLKFFFLAPPRLAEAVDEAPVVVLAMRFLSAGRKWASEEEEVVEERVGDVDDEEEETATAAAARAASCELRHVTVGTTALGEVDERSSMAK